MKRQFLARHSRVFSVGCVALLASISGAHADDAAPAVAPPAEPRAGVFAPQVRSNALRPGDVAPAFVLPGVDGKLISSRGWLSQRSLLVVSFGAPQPFAVDGVVPVPTAAEQVLAARQVAEAVKGAAPRLQKRGVVLVVIAEGPYFDALKTALGADFKAATIPDVIEPESPNLFVLRDGAALKPEGNEQKRLTWNTFVGRSDSGVSLTGIDLAGFVRLNESVGDLNSLESLLSLTGDVSPRVEIGKVAPDFSVTDAQGRTRRLSDLRGRKNLLLTFFPKCFTGGCANHLTSLQAERLAFGSLNTEVWAVSFDPAEGERGQLAFARQLSLSMPLIPDVTKNLSMLYESALSPDQPAAGRMSVLIDRDGIVRFVDRAVQVRSHGPDMLLKMRELGMK